MHREAEATGQPGDPRGLDPLVLTMDLAALVQGITGAFATAQAGAAQDAIDRLAAHGRQLAEARDPFSAVVIQMDCCLAMLEVATTRFRAALTGLPHPRTASTAFLSEPQSPSTHERAEQAADAHPSRGPSRKANASIASDGRAPGGRQE
ncbi:hypothetical protein [Roseomonas fluvialis]|uniref:Uncharacterized protein n=1 Tax=Roseomonas fluvialis TaxID=1750527 RepID=A0ABM7Y1H4_9PROT|nr:hypothetical protein [Roseomonas fluvialis]BDG71651.1 hypothetical protein Rmf_15800 [Roseomonas fluvialis]